MNLIKPSFSTGYAKNPSESANPNLWKGLVGAWMPSFGVTGGTLKDVSGNGNDGALTNMDAATDWVATSKGLALDFDGVNDYVDCGSDSKFELTESFSLECWAKTKGVSNVRTIAGNIDTTSDNCNYRIALTNSNSLAVGQFTSAGSFKNVSIAGPLNNTWNHYVLTWDNASLTIYLNTASSSANYSGLTPDTNFTKFYVGRFTSGVGTANDFWNGQLFSVRVYDRALSPSEIKQLYLNPSAPFLRKQQTVGISTAAVAPSANFNPFSVLTHPLEQ